MIVRTTDQRASKAGDPRMIIPAGVTGTMLALALVVGVPAEAGTPTDALREVFTGVNKVLRGPMREDQLAARVLNARAAEPHPRLSERGRARPRRRLVDTHRSGAGRVHRAVH